MALSEAQKRANLKYRENHSAIITMTVKKEVKERYKAEAEKRGLSLQGFMCQCVNQVIGLDTES